MKRKLSEKKRKKVKKAKKVKKREKIYLNFASLCFASKQKLLNRSEAKNLKRKKAKKRAKKQKKRKKSEKNEKNEKINLNFASLCFTSKQKLPK